MPNQDGTGPLGFGPETGRFGRRFTTLSRRRRRRRVPRCPVGVVPRRSARPRATGVCRLSSSSNSYSK